MWSCQVCLETNPSLLDEFECAHCGWFQPRPQDSFYAEMVLSRDDERLGLIASTQSKRQFYSTALLDSRVPCSKDVLFNIVSFLESSLHQGELTDVRIGNKWTAACIAAISGKMLTIHFLGYPKSFDEVISCEQITDKIAPFMSFTKGIDSIPSFGHAQLFSRVVDEELESELVSLGHDKRSVRKALLLSSNSLQSALELLFSGRF